MGGRDPWRCGFLQFQKLDSAKWPQLRSSCALITKWCQISLVGHVVIYSRLTISQVLPATQERGLSKSSLFNFLQYYTHVLLVYWCSYWMVIKMSWNCSCIYNRDLYQYICQWNKSRRTAISVLILLAGKFKFVLGIESITKSGISTLVPISRWAVVSREAKKKQHACAY